jgi:hypothetical protein
MDGKIFASVRMTDEIKSDRLFSDVPITNMLSQHKTRRRKTAFMRMMPPVVAVAAGAAVVYLSISG